MAGFMAHGIEGILEDELNNNNNAGYDDPRLLHPDQGFDSDGIMYDQQSDYDETTDSEEISWISWFCSLQGHEYYCQVPEEFIEDEFNLTGISSVVSHYNEALDRILDIEDYSEMYHNLSEEENRVIDQCAEITYGLIHARYIITRNGLADMSDKYEHGDFGVCQRLGCRGTYVVPCGVSDALNIESVKLYCPNCFDVYNPSSYRFQEIDGAFFGTTFPHMFFMTYPEYVPDLTQWTYKPKLFGFRISELSSVGSRMGWLRYYPPTEGDSDMDYDYDDYSVQSEAKMIDQDGPVDAPMQPICIEDSENKDLSRPSGSNGSMVLESPRTEETTKSLDRIQLSDEQLRNRLFYPDAKSGNTQQGSGMDISAPSPIPSKTTPR